MSKETEVTQPIGEPSRLKATRVVLCGGCLALLAVTWRLWTPQDLFPRVPMLSWISTWPNSYQAGITWSALLVQCSMLAVLLFAQKVDRLMRVVFAFLAISYLVLILLDQHRLQPWAIHIGVTLFLLLFAPPQKRLERICWFHVSIYVYSALGKLDAQFLHTVGQDFVRTAWQMLGFDWEAVPARTRFWMATALPISELIVGLLLAPRPTRPLAAVGAILMHATLIGLLGPWGLRHGWGVIVWNWVFLALVGLLFLKPTESRPTESRPTEGTTVSKGSTGSRGQFGIRVIDAMLLVVIVAPLGERFGLVDHWLGWALYAPHSSRAQVLVSVTAIDRLPEAVRPFVVRNDSLDLLWCQVRMDRWSLDALRVPIYPQQRFQFGVARALAGLVGDGDIRVQLLGTADRWTGRREERWLNGRRELLGADNYWFSTIPIFSPPAIPTP